MIYFEAERANPSGGIYHQKDTNISFGQHLHNSFELIYVYSGQIDITIEDRSFVAKGGEAILVLPNQIHGIKSLMDSESYLCVFENGMVGEFYQTVKNCDVENHIFTIKDKNLINVLMYAKQNRYKLKACLYDIISDFVEQCGLFFQKKYRSNEVIGKILNFISDHYMEDITIQDVEKEIVYDYHYLSNLLQKGLNTTFRAILNEYRISHACYLLISKENKISNIALECGYDSLCSFNRNFKSITGTTPIEFRRKELSVKE